MLFASTHAFPFRVFHLGSFEGAWLEHVGLEEILLTDILVLTEDAAVELGTVQRVLVEGFEIAFAGFHRIAFIARILWPLTAVNVLRHIPGLLICEPAGLAVRHVVFDESRKRKYSRDSRSPVVGRVAPHGGENGFTGFVAQTFTLITVADRTAFRIQRLAPVNVRRFGRLRQTAIAATVYVAAVTVHRCARRQPLMIS